MAEPPEFNTNDPTVAKISVACYLADISTPKNEVGDKALIEWLTRFVMAYEIIHAAAINKSADSIKPMIEKIKDELQARRSAE